jgi:hypothetical protein
MIRHESVFSTEEWRRIPFLRYPRSHIGRIIDIASLTSSLLSRIDLLITRPTQVRVTETLEIKRETLDLEEQLNRIWDELWHSSQMPKSDDNIADGIHGIGVDQPDITQSPDGTSSAHKSTLSSVLPSATSSPTLTRPPQFPANQNDDSMFNVGHLRCMAFYSAARLLVLSILRSVNAAPTSYEEQTQGHCARILTTASTMNDVHVGYVYLRLLLPLRVVAILGNPEQRERAKEINPKYGLHKGVSGSGYENNFRETKRG